MGASGGGNRPQLLIDLILNGATAFVQSVQGTLNTTLGAVSQWSTNVQAAISKAFNNQQQVQQAAANFQHLTLELQINQKVWANLSTDIDKFVQLSTNIPKNLKNLQPVMDEIRNRVIAFGESWQEAGQNVIASGEEILRVQSALSALGKNPLNLDQVNESLELETTNVERAATSLPLLTIAEKNAADASLEGATSTNVLSDALDFLTNRIKTVVASLLIVTVIFQTVQAIKDLSAASKQLAQDQEELAIAVDAAYKGSQGVTGAMDQWNKIIDQLHISLQTFSKEDITNAVTQALRLTDALGLTKDQVSNLIQVSAELAQTSGKDLTTVLDEVGKAVAGGRLQDLENYGIVIHQNEIADEAFAEGLGKNVQNLTDQELATVRLNLVMQKMGDISSSAAGYQESLAGQIKTTDAQITDSKNKISDDLSSINLLFENLYSSFINHIAKITDQFLPLFNFIKQINDLTSQENKAAQATGGNIPTAEAFGIRVARGAGEVGKLALSNIDIAIANGDYQKAIDIIGNSQTLLQGNLKQFTDLIEAAKIYSTSLKDIQTAQANPSSIYLNPGTLQGSNTGVPSNNGSTNNPDLTNALAQASKDIPKYEDAREAAINKATADYSDAIAKAGQRWIQDDTKAFNDEQAAIQKAAQNLKDSIAKDTETYNRELGDIEYSDAEKRATAEEEKDKAIADNKKKYYDSLRKLDEDYYFSISDAVANNDAIAILKAQQKYAVDKDNLKNNYDDQNQTAYDNYQDKIKQIQQQTIDSKRLLDERYQQQLKDLKDQYQKELQAANQNYADKLAADKQAFQDTKDQAKAAEDDKVNTANQNYAEELNALDAQIKATFDKDAGGMFDSLTQWQAYYQSKINLLTDYYAQAQQIIDNNGGQGTVPNPGPGPQSTNCPSGTYWSDIFQACVPNDIRGGTTTLTSSTSSQNIGVKKILIGSDGTVSDVIINSVIKEIAGVVQTVIIERGG